MHTRRRREEWEENLLKSEREDKKLGREGRRMDEYNRTKKTAHLGQCGLKKHHYGDSIGYAILPIGPNDNNEGFLYNPYTHTWIIHPSIHLSIYRVMDFFFFKQVHSFQLSDFGQCSSFEVRRSREKVKVPYGWHVDEWRGKVSWPHLSVMPFSFFFFTHIQS